MCQLEGRSRPGDVSERGMNFAQGRISCHGKSRLKFREIEFDETPCACGETNSLHALKCLFSSVHSMSCQVVPYVPKSKTILEGYKISVNEQLCGPGKGGLGRYDHGGMWLNSFAE